MGKKMSEYETDLIGKRIGYLEVLEKDTEKTKQGKAKWICLCHACGKKKSIPRGRITQGDVKSCGCKYNNRIKPENNIDLTGKYFGELKVLRKLSGRGCRTIWEVQCGKCKKIYPVVQSALKVMKSCGCLDRERSRKNVSRYVGNVNGTTASLILSKKNYANNTSGRRGVSFKKNINKWHSYIAFQGELYNLGFFEKKEDAIKAREKAEKEMYGDFLEWYKKEYPLRWEKLKNKPEVEN